MKKKMLILFVLLVLIILGVFAKLFFIGEPVDGCTLSIQVEDLPNQINIYAVSPDSGLAFTDMKLRQKDSVLYITMEKVLVSPIYDSGEASIYLEKTGLTDIYFCGEHIWSIP